jgi:hypothetical protein
VGGGFDPVLVRPIRFAAFILWNAADRFVIDLVLVNGVGMLVVGVGKLVKYVQNGDVQRYLVGLAAGTAAILYVATNYAACSSAKFDVAASGRDVEVRAHDGGPTAKRLQYRITWQKGEEPSTPQSSPIFHHTYASAGDYRITVEVLDPRWGTNSHETRVVTVP